MLIWLVQSVLDGRPIVLHGQDGIRINPTYVADAVTAIEADLVLEGSHKINIGGPEVLTMRQIGEMIAGKQSAKPHGLMCKRGLSLAIWSVIFAKWCNCSARRK